MGIIKRWIGYFFKGIRVIADNKIAVIVIFCLGVFLLNKTLCYREEIINYEKDDIEEKVFVKGSDDVNYYYDNNEVDVFSKDIAADELVSCINSKIDLDNVEGDIENIILELNSLFNENEDYFSFLYKDIYTGFTVSYNENTPIFTASSIKAPAMIYLYEMASEGNINLDEELVYTENYYSNGSGVLKNNDFDTKYSVDTLIDYTIKDSDNAAYRMLMDRYGRENVLSFWEDLGTKYIFTYDTIWGVTSASDAAIYMSELYDFYIENDEYGNKLMDLFKNSSWKIITNKDGEFNTASKGGWSDEAFHDVAIVFEENPYILVIMSKAGEYFSEYNYLFSSASKLVGELHSKYWEYKMDMCSDIKQY